MSDKTEQPTSKRLRDARKKGQVAKSQEVCSSATILAVFMYLWMAWDGYVERLKNLILLPTGYYDAPFELALGAVVSAAAKEILLLSLPVCLTAAVIGVMANFFQVGALLSFESVKPDLNKLNPAQGIKKIFSIKNLIELVKSLVKVVFLTWLLWIIIRDAIDPLMKLPSAGMSGVVEVLGPLMKQVVKFSAGAFIVIAAFDYFFQKRQHIKGLMMTKDEVKREYKEMEGDPHIKGKRKQLHKEMVMSNTMQQTRKASVLVTNPTHLAIALFYDKDKTKLPVVLAKGEAFLAKRMVEIAKEEGIPIMQNVPLARALYEEATVDQYIPSDLIEPVAEVLRWVQQLKQGR